MQPVSGWRGNAQMSCSREPSEDGPDRCVWAAARREPERCRASGCSAWVFGMVCSVRTRWRVVHGCPAAVSVCGVCATVFGVVCRVCRCATTRSPDRSGTRENSTTVCSFHVPRELDVRETHLMCHFTRESVLQPGKVITPRARPFLIMVAGHSPPYVGMWVRVWPRGPGPWASAAACARGEPKHVKSSFHAPSNGRSFEFWSFDSERTTDIQWFEWGHSFVRISVSYFVRSFGKR